MQSIVLLCTLLVGFVVPRVTTEPKPVPSLLGRVIPSFALPSTSGTTVSLDDYPSAKGFVVVFTCNHCPFAKLYTRRLNALSAKYAPQDVPVLVINAMDTTVYGEETMAEMQQRATSAHFAFPYLHDAEQRVGKSFAADHTPMAYVIWKEHGVWRTTYAGAIDDNGAEPTKATPYVANAIEALLHNTPIPLAETQSFGCAIYYRE
jgi:peroxiredoxin